MFYLSSEALLSSLSPLVLFETLPGRCSFWFRWRLLVGWVSCRLSLLRSLLPVAISSRRIFRSFGLSRSPKLVLFLALSAFVLWQTLWVIFWMNFSVLFVLFVAIFLGRLLFLLALGLSSFLLLLLLVLCRKMLLVSSFGMSLRSPIPQLVFLLLRCLLLGCLLSLVLFLSSSVFGACAWGSWVRFFLGFSL